MRKSYEFWDFHEGAASICGKIRGVVADDLIHKVTIRRNYVLQTFPVLFQYNKLAEQTKEEIITLYNGVPSTIRRKQRAKSIEVSYEDYIEIKDELDQENFDSFFPDALKQYFAFKKLEYIMDDNPSEMILASRGLTFDFETGQDVLMKFVGE